MSMFNDISWRSKDNEQGCELSAKLISIYARDEEFVFLVADGPAKLSGIDYEFQEATLIRNLP